MKAVAFVGGLLLTACFGAIGLLLSAASPTGVQYLQNDLIAIVLVGLLIGSALAWVVWALRLDLP